MFEGENWTEKKYAVAGDILDGHLYDLFMTMLEVDHEYFDSLKHCQGIKEQELCTVEAREFALG